MPPRATVGLVRHRVWRDQLYNPSDAGTTRHTNTGDHLGRPIETRRWSAGRKIDEGYLHYVIFTIILVGLQCVHVFPHACGPCAAVLGRLDADRWPLQVPTLKAIDTRSSWMVLAQVFS